MISMISLVDTVCIRFILHTCEHPKFYSHTCTGKQDQLLSVNGSIWAKGMLESEAAPLLCPGGFKQSLEEILHSILGLTVRDINHNNCQSVYLKLVRQVYVAINDGRLRFPMPVE